MLSAAIFHGIEGIEVWYVTLQPDRQRLIIAGSSTVRYAVNLFIKCTWLICVVKLINSYGISKIKIRIKSEVMPQSVLPIKHHVVY